MASHFYPVVYMRDTLLPKGEITGWCPGNYCGFPLFQFYFPLPFLIMRTARMLVPSRSPSSSGRYSAAPLPICSTWGFDWRHPFPRSGDRRADYALLPFHGGEHDVGWQHPFHVGG